MILVGLVALAVVEIFALAVTAFVIYVHIYRARNPHLGEGWRLRARVKQLQGSDRAGALAQYATLRDLANAHPREVPLRLSQLLAALHLTSCFDRWSLGYDPAVLGLLLSDCEALLSERYATRSVKQGASMLIAYLARADRAGRKLTHPPLEN